jgi:hypothetical protein
VNITGARAGRGDQTQLNESTQPTGNARLVPLIITVQQAHKSTVGRSECATERRTNLLLLNWQPSNVAVRITMTAAPSTVASLSSKMQFLNDIGACVCREKETDSRRERCIGQKCRHNTKEVFGFERVKAASMETSNQGPSPSPPPPLSSAHAHLSRARAS